MLRTVKLLLLALPLLVAGCASQGIDISNLPSATKHTATVVETDGFNIQTLQPMERPGETLRVYIEGDGRAWITSRTISSDPTPTKSLMLQYAIADAKPSVYMARACQYVQGGKCNKMVWTDERFSSEVVIAHNDVLNQLKSKYGNQRFELVGHSGGAAIALLVAAGRDDVTQVQAIAGNLDHAAWTEELGLRALGGSLNPAEYATELKSLPQRLYMGMNDTIVKSNVLTSYLDKVEPSCAEVHVIAANHWDGFDEAWEETKDIQINCSRAPGEG